MALKSGSISGSGSDTALIDKVAPASPTLATLGILVGAILLNAAADQLIVIDTGRRKVGAVNHTTGLASQLATDVSALVPDETFSLGMADDTKMSSEWTLVGSSTSGGTALTGLASAPSGRTALGGLLNDAIGFSKPTRSGSSLIDAIESALADVSVDKQAFIIVNQNAKTIFVSVVADTTATSDLAANGGNVTFTSTFTQTIAAAAAVGTGWFRQ